jgi:hypothetical protein
MRCLDLVIYKISCNSLFIANMRIIRVTESALRSNSGDRMEIVFDIFTTSFGYYQRSKKRTDQNTKYSTQYLFGFVFSTTSPVKKK